MQRTFDLERATQRDAIQSKQQQIKEMDERLLELEQRYQDLEAKQTVQTIKQKRELESTRSDFERQIELERTELQGVIETLRQRESTMQRRIKDKDDIIQGLQQSL
jgi:hypothetical protein